MKVKEKQRSIYLRNKGYSIKEIARILKVSKGSVSVWVRDVELSESQKYILRQKNSQIDLIERRRNTRLKNENSKRQKIISCAKLEIKNISVQELKILGTMLYWAEGGKTARGSVRFSNSDPEMIKTMMVFFRKICKVPESKFRGHIHMYDHANVKNAEKFWSNVTSIPKKQFFKTYAKNSKSSLGKRKTLLQGTFDIYVCDTKLFLTIQGWIEKIREVTLISFK